MAKKKKPARKSGPGRRTGTAGGSPAAALGSMAARNLVNMVAVAATSTGVLLCLLAAKRLL